MTSGRLEKHGMGKNSSTVALSFKVILNHLYAYSYTGTVRRHRGKTLLNECNTPCATVKKAWKAQN